MGSRELKSGTVALWLLCACNQYAVLDAELDLPPQPTGPELFVQVQAARANLPFELDWEGATSLETVRLGPTRQIYQFSLRTRDPDTDVHVRVRFCRERGCTFIPAFGDDALADPVAEVQYVVERPFYVQARSPTVTTWRATIGTPPRCQTCTTPEECAFGECVEGVCREELDCVAEPQDDCEPVAARQPSLACFVDKCEIACGTIAGMPSAGYCEVGPRGERVHFCE